MASFWYQKGLEGCLDGSIDLDTDTIKVMLVTSGYTANKDHDFVSDLTPGSNELSGTGYTGGFGGSGRKSLASKTVLVDDATDVVNFDAADVTWTAINAGTIRAAVLIKEITNDAASRLIAYIDNAAEFPLTTNGGDVTIQWNSGGILRISA